MIYIVKNLKNFFIGVLFKLSFQYLRFQNTNVFFIIKNFNFYSSIICAIYHKGSFKIKKIKKLEIFYKII